MDKKELIGLLLVAVGALSLLTLIFIYSVVIGIVSLSVGMIFAGFVIADIR